MLSESQFNVLSCTYKWSDFYADYAVHFKHDLPTSLTWQTLWWEHASLVKVVPIAHYIY